MICWRTASSVEQHKLCRALNVKNAFQSMCWQKFYSLRLENLILSTLAEKACCNLSNFFRLFARLRWLRVLEEGNCIGYQLQIKTRKLSLDLCIKRHLPSLAIIIEAITRPTECTHFNSDFGQMPAWSSTMRMSVSPYTFLLVFNETGPLRLIDCLVPPPVCHKKMEASY